MRSGGAFTDVSLRHKRVLILRGPQDRDELRAVAHELVARREAAEVALDLRSPGPVGDGAPAGPGEATALLHVYGAQGESSGGGPGTASLCCAALGGEEHGILERVVFDRRRADEELSWASGWVRIGTQVRQAHLDRAAFVQHWGAVHAELVRAHHPGAVRYVQSYRVWSAPGAAAFDGFYESYFPAVEDWTLRLFDSRRGEELLSRDAAGFLEERGSERLWVKRERFGLGWEGILPG